MFLVTAFEEKCSTLTLGSFLYAYKRSTFLFICSINYYGCSKHLRRQNIVGKKNKTDIQNLENILRITKVSRRSNSAPRGFFRKIYYYNPSLLVYCNTVDVKKSQRCPPSPHCDCSELSFFVFFRKLFNVSKWSPSIFRYFTTNWIFKKPKGFPFCNFKNFALSEP